MRARGESERGAEGSEGTLAGRVDADLVRAGLRDTHKRFGFSLGTPRGQRFADFHVANPRAGEAW